MIGVLKHTGKTWVFEYSEWFKGQDHLNPLANFPEKHETEVLPPFFASRIPSLNQPKVRKKIEEVGIDQNDLVELLRVFGRRTIANPFTLCPQS